MAWTVIDPLIQYWDKHTRAKIPLYQAGTWGPVEADALLARDGVKWR
jgi:glucose-6-phosphate 1-dehydrogenase